MERIFVAVHFQPVEDFRLILAFLLFEELVVGGPRRDIKSCLGASSSSMLSPLTVWYRRERPLEASFGGEGAFRCL